MVLQRLADAGLWRNSSPPSAPQTGQLWLDTNTSPPTLKAWSGSAWEQPVSSGELAASILTKLLTVDGAGSGLDADLLDGLNSGDFFRTNTTAITDANIASANKDGAAGTASLRTLGTGATQAAAGNHTHAQLHNQAHNLFSTDHPDVDATDTPGNGEVLTYNSAISKWQSAAVGAAVSEVTGVVKMWAGASAPTGYLLCDGAAVSRTTYAALYTALGGASSPWGQGDGSTTFNVPDMRGRAPIGVGQGTGLTNRTLGATVGSETHTLTTGEMPAHTHSVPYDSAGNTAGGGSGARMTQLDAASPSDPGTDGATSTGGGAAHPNMQPSVALNFIIKS